MGEGLYARGCQARGLSRLCDASLKKVSAPTNRDERTTWRRRGLHKAKDTASVPSKEPRHAMLVQVGRMVPCTCCRDSVPDQTHTCPRETHVSCMHIASTTRKHIAGGCGKGDRADTGQQKNPSTSTLCALSTCLTPALFQPFSFSKRSKLAVMHPNTLGCIRVCLMGTAVIKSCACMRSTRIGVSQTEFSSASLYLRSQNAFQRLMVSLPDADQEPVDALVYSLGEEMSEHNAPLGVHRTVCDPAHI